KAVSEGGRSAMEEERRLAYVAFTRAKQQLYISDARGYSFVLDQSKRPSRFIFEIDEDCIENYGYQPEREPMPKMIESEQSPLNRIRLRKGDIVEHKSFGEGIVLDTSNGIWTIAFKNKFGIRKIIANHPSIIKK
ncbi:MAG: 3'-5' exonuclease, partial [Traorella sp.]